VSRRVTLTGTLAGWLAALAVRAYPRGFRRRFGEEMRADLQRVLDTTGTRGVFSQIGMFAVTGLAERATALRQRLLRSPQSRRPLYEPQDRHAALWDALLWDLRRALRHARRTPFVTGLTVLALALGIGATTAVYSAVDAAFFRPLPFPQADRLVRLADIHVPIDYSDLQRADGGDPGDAPRMVLRASRLGVTDLAAMRDVFAHSAVLASGAVNLGSGAEPLRIEVTFVTAEFFAVLGRDAAHGRGFTAEEAAAGGPRVTVLSHRLWHAHFAADPATVGTTILLNDVPHQVVGIMPEDVRFPSSAQAWVPMPVPVRWTVVQEAFRNFLPAVVVARLAPGVTTDAARERLDVARRVFAPAGSDDERRLAPAADLVTPLRQWLVGDRATALTVLMVGAVLVLLVACANAATLLLSLAAVRRREVATHVVLGATRGRLLSRVLVEGGTIALASAAAGIGLAAGGLSLLEALLPPGLTGLAPMRLDARVLAVTLSLTLLTAILSSLWPAAHASRVNLADALRDAGGRAVSASSRLTSGLVVAEVALACLLVIAAWLMLTSLHGLLSTDVGMRTDRVATARLSLPPSRYGDPVAITDAVQRTLAHLRTMPGVRRAAAINTLPLAGEMGIALALEPEGGYSGEPPPIEQRFAPFLMVSPEYFQTMGIALLRGRDLTWTDSRQRPVALVNRTAAQRLWPGEDPIGKRFQYVGGGPSTPTVVGVVDDARVSQLTAEAGPQVYLPLQDQPQNYLALVAQGVDHDDVSSVLARIREAVHAVDPTLPVYAAQPMDVVIGTALASRRVNTVLLGTFAAVALCLAVIGVYGTLAYAVARRTREIGIRRALGASRASILALVVRQGVGLVGVGTVLGVAGALATTRYLESLLHGVTPRDPRTIGAVVVLFALVALAASYLPARRACAVDPLEAVRQD
jgi:putative ABC transport system permease protein